jgi:hypothetical protein
MEGVVVMGQELAHRWPEVIKGPTKRAVLQELARAWRAGELAAAAQLRQEPDGRWSVLVMRIRERRVVPVWRRTPVLVAAGTVGALAGLAALGWWLAGLAMGAAGAVSLPLLLGGGAVLLVARAAVRRSSGCRTRVTVEHWH